MYKLACVIPRPNDSTSWYRAIGPLSHLAKQNRKLSVYVFERFMWSNVVGMDAVFFQRPSSADHVNAIQMTKELGLKVWVDYDDLLTQVPVDNPSYEIYGKKEVQKNIIMATGLADLVTASTQQLADEICKINPNVVVVRNALNLPLVHHYRNTLQMPKRKKILVWRGSKTHQRDVMTYGRAIDSSANHEQSKEWMWYFIGYNPWFVTLNMPHKQTLIGEELDIMEYHRHMYEIAPSCIHVPLHDSIFNRCKSNIAWIEGAFAGCPAIVPDWPEWQRAGTLRYKDQLTYQQQLMAVMKGEVDVQKLATEAWEDVMQNYTLDRVNHLRAEAIAKVMGIEAKDLR